MKNNILSIINPDLPLEGKIRFNQVKRLTGFSRPTIWRMGRAGKFPKSMRITPRLTVWDPEAWGRRVRAAGSSAQAPASPYLHLPSRLR